jgi:flagellar hook-associated protein 2
MDSAASWPTTGQLVITQGRRSGTTGSALTFNYADYTSLDGLKDAINTAGPYKAQVLTSVSPTGTTRYLSISRGTGAERNFFVSTKNGNSDLTTGLYVRTPTYTNGVLTTDPGQANGVDAKIVSGGHEYTNFKNTFTDLMPGVTVTVNALTETNKPVNLSTSVDTSKFTSIVRQIVSSYNNLQGTISDEIKYDLDVKKRGGLANDYVARSFLGQMRRMTTDSITTLNGNNVSLASLGVRTNIDGTLTIDETKLTAATQNPDLMEAVLSSTTSSTGTIKGAFEKMNDFADMIMGKNGALVTLYNKTEKTDMKKYEDKLAKLNSDMDSLKQRYMKQFISMQDYLNTTKSAQNSLTQSMTAWTASMKG